MSDVQQVVSKVKPNCTYTNTANYWALLADKDNDDGYDKAAPAQQATINNISNAEVQRDLRSTIMAWINQRMSKHKPFQRKASTMVVDSGETSIFVWPDPSPDSPARLLIYPMDLQYKQPIPPCCRSNHFQMKQEKQTSYQGCGLTP
jgi:hypothetical protein